MSKPEVKVMVEYIIEMPDDIKLADVDNYITGEIDEGEDSEKIKSRIITDVAFADKAGLVERYQRAHGILEQVENMMDPENKDVNVKSAAEFIYPLVRQTLDDFDND